MQRVDKQMFHMWGRHKFSEFACFFPPLDSCQGEFQFPLDVNEMS